MSYPTLDTRTCTHARTRLSLATSPELSELTPSLSPDVSSWLTQKLHPGDFRKHFSCPKFSPE